MQTNQVAIIGGGLTGLSLAYFLKKRGIPSIIFEEKSRIGGAIQTIKKNGFSYETGPNTGVLGNIEIENLLKNLSTDCTLETANESAKRRLIWKNNRWNDLPSGLLSGITTPLFSTKDKLRILGEPFRKKGTNPNENLQELVERRLGKSFHDYAIAPFINGVYAGDTAQLIPRFALPKLYNLEQEYGSFIKGAILKNKYNKENNIPQPSKKVFSTQGGLEQITEALGKQVSESILYNCKNIQIEKSNDEFEITWNSDTEFQKKKFSHVISTINAHNLIEILPQISDDEKEILSKVTYAPVIQVSIGFNTWEGININAFGGLIPPIENKDILGILFTSSMFENRAPKNGALLSVFMGGMLKQEIFSKTDTEIIEIIKTNIKTLLDIPNFDPQLLEIHRYKKAITQYTIHMDDVNKTIDSIEKKFKNLIIAGSIKNGIGMADRVKQAFDISEKITF